MEEQNHIIEIQNLNKTYIFSERDPKRGVIYNLFYRINKVKYALINFSISINYGEIVGIIGPNGAGKTTLTKMLTGIIHPTSGSISVLGFKPYQLRDDFKKKIALVMGQKTQLWWDLPVIDTFLLNKELYEIPNELFKKNLEFFLSLMEVEDLLNVQVRRLSLGERMKMELISCLLHDPVLLFLDEPTLGLDLIAQKKIRQYLKEINRTKGTTILLTSHYMDDIEYLCNRVVIVRKGEKIYDGEIEDLKNKYANLKYISITFEDGFDSEYFRKDNVIVMDESPQSIKICVAPEELHTVLNRIVNQFLVSDIKVLDEQIESIIEKIYIDGAEYNEKN